MSLQAGFFLLLGWLLIPGEAMAEPTMQLRRIDTGRGDTELVLSLARDGKNETVYLTDTDGLLTLLMVGTTIFNQGTDANNKVKDWNSVSKVMKNNLEKAQEWYEGKAAQVEALADSVKGAQDKERFLAIAKVLREDAKKLVWKPEYDEAIGPRELSELLKTVSALWGDEKFSAREYGARSSIFPSSGIAEPIKWAFDPRRPEEAVANDYQKVFQEWLKDNPTPWLARRSDSKYLYLTSDFGGIINESTMPLIRSKGFGDSNRHGSYPRPQRPSHE